LAKQYHKKNTNLYLR